MNKADLVDKIAGACEISKAQATTAIDTAVDSVTSALRKGDRVALIGFGTFSVSQRKARNGRNPQTGATIKIAAPGVNSKKPSTKSKSKFHLKVQDGRGSALPFLLGLFPCANRAQNPPVLPLQAFAYFSHFRISGSVGRFP